MPRPSQKDAIQAAALVCFARQGYGATRIRDIAHQAGVSEAALYRHYASKEAVANELFCQHFRAFGVRLDALAGAEEPADAALRAIANAILAAYRAGPDAFSFVVLASPEFMPTLPPDTVYPLDVIERVMRRGQLSGQVRAGQPNLLAAIFLGCILRPIIVAKLADPGALDLLSDQRHDPVILDAALGAVTPRPAGA